MGEEPEAQALGPISYLVLEFRVSRRQANRWAAQDQQAYYQQEQQYAQPQYAHPPRRRLPIRSPS